MKKNRDLSFERKNVEYTDSLEMDMTEIDNAVKELDKPVKVQINYERIDKIIDEIQFLSGLLALHDEQHNEDLISRIGKLTRMYKSEIKGE